MKYIFEQLSGKERELLAHLYTTESYKALKHLLELERLNTATKLIDVAADDVVSISRHQGRADAYKQLNLNLKENERTFEKNKQRTQKQR